VGEGAGEVGEGGVGGGAMNRQISHLLVVQVTNFF
jgi:hypothetical protein